MAFKLTFVISIIVAFVALYCPTRLYLVNGSNLVSNSFNASDFTVTINNSTKDLFEFMDEGLKYINTINIKRKKKVTQFQINFKVSRTNQHNFKVNHIALKRKFKNL